MSKHVEPQPETILALRLMKLAGTACTTCAWESARICKLAQQYRRLNEHGCNVQLTTRQEARKESLAKRADDLLKPYGLEMSNPWGLCMYAMPIGADGSSQSVATFLA